MPGRAVWSYDTTAPLAIETGGSPTSITRVALAATNLQLRLDRTPGTGMVNGSYSLDGLSWTVLGTTNQAFVNPRLGIWTGGAQSSYTGSPNCDLQRLDVVVSNNVATALTYTLLNPPAGAGIDTNGLITWRPTEAQGPGPYVFTTVVTDNSSPPFSATNSFTVTVAEVNTAPVLPPQTDLTLSGLQALTVTNTATDSDWPANVLSYLLAGPSGASIDTSGVIRWLPTAAQVPSTNLFTTVVTDTNPWAVNARQLSATNSFIVVVNPLHNGPVLSLAQTNWSVNELTQLVITNTATDTDLPALGLNYSLVAPPAGARIDANGIFTWTPDESQGPATNVITTIVTDSGAPPLSATNSFTVIVAEVNAAPLLPAQGDRTLVAGSTVVVTNTATDADWPDNTLTYMLLNPPVGASIDANGIITWTPSASGEIAPLAVGVGPLTNLFTTVVTDFNPWAVNAQALSATNRFSVVVRPAPTPPEITSCAVSAGLPVLTWTAAAGSVYRIQYVNALTETNWTDLSPEVTADGPTATATDTTGLWPQRFYRVLLVTP